MGNKKNLFTLAYAKKFLNKKGLELFKKNNQIKSNNSFKSLSYTALSGLILIIILTSAPIPTEHSKTGKKRPFQHTQEKFKRIWIFVIV